MKMKGMVRTGEQVWILYEICTDDESGQQYEYVVALYADKYDAEDQLKIWTAMYDLPAAIKAVTLNYNFSIEEARK